MLLTKLKLAAAALLLITIGSAVLVNQATAQRPAEHAGIIDRSTGNAGAADQTALRDNSLDVEMLERAWVDAIPRRDEAIVNRIIAEDFAGIDPVGNLFSKATYLHDLRNGLLTFRPIELDEIKTRIFGETAVVTSRIKIRGGPIWGRMTNVYVKKHGRWQCVASHASGVPPGGCPFIGTAAGGQMLNQVIGHVGVQPPGPVGQANTCVACHAANPHTGIQPSRPVRAQTPQPVGQANNCVTCHMVKKPG